MSEIATAPEQELGPHISVSIKNGVAEFTLVAAGTFLVVITDCQVVRLGDHLQFNLPRLGMRPINISLKDISSGSATLNFSLSEPLLISVDDQQGRQMGMTRVILV